MSDVVNPLDFSGTPVGFEAVGLSPNAGHTKDGTPYYKLTLFFRHKHQWDVFQLAKLKGASFAVVMNRVDEGAASGPIIPLSNNGTNLVEACDDPRPEKMTINGVPIFSKEGNSIKGGEIVKGEAIAIKPRRHVSETTLKAYELCRNPLFQDYVNSLEYEKTEDGARLFILTRCDINHRSEIDKSRFSARVFGDITADFAVWVANK